MDDEDDADFLPPATTSTFAIPIDPELQAAYDLYRPSMETRRLSNERNRTVFAEAFIESVNLGTLADLCVRALAKFGIRNIPDVIRNDPLKMRIFYDALDVNMPLQDCYFVDDLRFWRRVVLAKSSNKCLSLKKLDEYDWKSKGISLKYVELAESCRAVYWPEEKMSSLGKLVREYVRTLHIRHLQSLTEDSFKQYMDSESELEVSSDSRVSEISSDELDTADEGEEEDEEEETVPEREPLPTKKKFVGEKFAVEVFNPVDGAQPESRKKASDTELDLKRRQARAARNAARQQLRDLQQEKLTEQRRRKLKSIQMMGRSSESKSKKKRNKKRNDSKAVDDVFNMSVPPEPQDNEDQKVDGRNKEKLLLRKKRYTYPAKHCHHIDLSFVRYFDQLVSLTVEFLGPEMERDFHHRHLNFSYDDMVHLASGLRTLSKLKIFRLRNSRMDHIKLLILARSLRLLDQLEVVDFGYDQLNDQCRVALDMLLDRPNMLRVLELEYNRLERAALQSIGEALKYHSIQNPDSRPMEYLGLAHNPLNDMAFMQFVSSILGTKHVQELNINGVEIHSTRLTYCVSLLLRKHTPLRVVNMVAVKDLGRQLICALETNHKVTHFDCRNCDMDTDMEYEADVIVRRNNFERIHTYLGNEKQTEKDILNFLANMRHPILTKIEYEMAQRDKCLKNQQPETSSELAVAEEHVEEVEEEFDIWTMLGIRKSEVKEEIAYQSPDLSEKVDEPFVYDPNKFTLDEFREHLYLPGPQNRYAYFQKQKES